MAKNKMSFKEKMNQPYTKGDYYRGIGIAFGLYALIGIGYAAYYYGDTIADCVKSIGAKVVKKSEYEEEGTEEENEA